MWYFWLTVYALYGPPELCIELVPDRDKILSGFDQKKHFTVYTVQRGEEGIIHENQILAANSEKDFMYELVRLGT